MFHKMAFGYKVAALLTQLYGMCKKEFGAAGQTMFYGVLFVSFVLGVKAVGITTTIAWQAFSILWPVVLIAVLIFFWYLHKTSLNSEGQKSKAADAKKDGHQKEGGSQ
ncbi:MAG: hypothetical protein Q8R36_02420 [bacterium]|nr:hypothetical protein [bacterium]